MLTIENIHFSVPDKDIDVNVHPFYKDTIKVLFGADIQNLPHNTPSRNRLILSSILIKTMNDTHNVSYFFDVRLQEELGSPSPQYEILTDLGFSNVTPLCIHGKDLGVLQEGLLMADSLLRVGEQAIFAVSLLLCANWQSSENEFAFAFLATSDGNADRKIKLKGTMTYEK